MKTCITIAGKTYEIDCCNSDTKYDDNRAAYFTAKSQRIVVNTCYPLQTQHEALLHECIEVINYVFDLKLEHTAVCILGEMLYQALPTLANIILDKENANSGTDRTVRL